MGQEFEEILNENIMKIRPTGYSMYPVIIPDRDFVYIEKADYASLRRGDVILYKRQQPKELYVLHRIWKVRSDGVYTVGDNQTQTEGPLGQECILGRMIAMDRKGRHISVTNPLYRLMTTGWLCLRPLRRPVSVAVHGIKSIFKVTKER